MPNWCGNRLTAGGDAELLSDLRAAVAGATSEGKPMAISFERIAPTPAELVDGEQRSNWRASNWGTKWDPLPESVWVDEEENEGKFVVYFWTAWDPPLEAIDLLASRYPGLDFELVYNESGMGFAGYREWEGGQESDSDEATEPEDAARLLRLCDWESEASEWVDDEDE